MVRVWLLALWGGFFAVAADDRGYEDLIKIGELYQGRIEPKGWIPITRSRTATQPYPAETASWSRSDTTLWTGIASFRDDRCGLTLFNLFSKATYPERVTAGVVQQNLEGDEECLATYCKLMQEKKGAKGCPFRDNIRVLAMDARESQGPCWGRHYQSYLLANEEFCMQVDSHMDFVQGWDMAMMEEWAATNNEYGVLSTYVQDFKSLGVNLGKRWEVAHLCEVFFPSTQQPRNQQARAIHDMAEPKLTTTWGAGYSFSKCHAERRVPYDPYLEKIFDGEEFSRMARLWTNGYDVYTPRRGHLVHDYSHPNDKTTTSWRSNKGTAGEGNEDRRAAANQRLWDLMEMPRSTARGSREMQGGPWGLGDRRSLDDFISFTGVDLRSMGHIGTTGDRCGSGVEWVPYDLGEGAGGGGDGDGGGEQPFASWRSRKGLDPVVAGPHWDEVKRKLQAAGVEMTWDPRSQTPKSPANDGDGSRRSREEVYDAAEAPAAKVRAAEVAELAAVAAAEAAAAGAEGPRGRNGGDAVGGGRPWIAFVAVVSCVGVTGVGCMGRRRRKKRRVSAKRRRQVMEWSANAFSTNTLSPLGGGPKSASPFAWTGAVRSKHHQV